MSSKSSSRLYPVDGVRALTHLSLILLHTTMITTAHLPSEGPLWETIKTHPVYTIFQAGGIQVDIMFVLSAFLLVDSLLSSEKIPNIFVYAIRRASRMLPSMALLLLVGKMLGDVWDLPFRAMDNSPDFQSRFAVVLLFISNYFNQSKYGSFTGSLLWSCSADFQMSVIVFFLVSMIRSSTIPSSTQITTSHRLVLASRLKYLFIMLIILSLIIRGVIFDPEVKNIVKLGQYSHMGLMMDNPSFEWVKVYYGHIWHTTNAAKALSQTYLHALYMPTHSRFGPFAVGGLLACNLFTSMNHQEEKPTSSFLRTIKQVLSFFGRWLTTLICIVLLIIPCTAPPPIGELPPYFRPHKFFSSDKNPIEAQFITTIAIRTLTATSVAYLLYRSLLPTSHPSSFPILSSILSLPLFKVIADISFASYLIHFRLLMEMIWNPYVRKLTGLALPLVTVTDQETVEVVARAWIQYIVVNGIFAVGISFTLASLYHYGFERHMTILLKKGIDSMVGTKNEKKEK